MVLHTLHRDQRAQHMYDQGGSVCRSSLARMAKAFHTVLWAMFLLHVLISINASPIGLKVYVLDVDQWGDGGYKDHTITKINPDGSYNTTERNNVSLAKLKRKVIHILPSLLFIEDGVIR